AGTQITFTITYTYNCEGGGELPGAFSLSSATCLVWPGPEVEVNFAVSANATSYDLQRRTGGGSFATVSSGTYEQLDHYTDTGLAQNTAYEYRVIANNANGSTISSNTLTVTTSQANCEPPSSTPVCTPGSQTVGVNTAASLSASSGNG